MNKLEQLKALLMDAQTQIPTNITAFQHERLRVLRGIALDRVDKLSIELLPHLIAVAEAAAKVCCHDFSVSDLDGDLMLDMRHIETLLLPLTKDTDK